MSKGLKDRQPQVIDLAGEDYDDEDTEIIKVGKRFYRVRQVILDAGPEDFSPWRFESPLDRRFCIDCAFELGRPGAHSPWAAAEDFRCVVHQRDQRSSRRIRPSCPYCGEAMEVVLPFEVPICSLRFVWICPERHTYLISDSLEGVF